MQDDMTSEVRTSLGRLVAISVGAAVLFATLFQASKLDAIRSVSPFAEDPYDAVASIGFQVALATGLVSLIRWLRFSRDEDIPRQRSIQIVRGCEIALAALTITLLTDAIALAASPVPLASMYASAIWGGLSLLYLAALTGVLASINALRRCVGIAVTAKAKVDNTVSGLIDDALVTSERISQTILGETTIVNRIVNWLLNMARRALDRLNSTAISPRGHPWRFCAALALAAGVWLVFAKFVFEGPPPSLQDAFLLIVIFLGVEFSATMAGYLMFGGVLGIRPPIGEKSEST